MKGLKMNKNVLVLALLMSPLLLTAANYPSDLVFYSKFDSESDVVTPQVGPTGTVHEVTFEDGVYGKALHVPVLSCVAEYALPTGLPEGKGCIEFQAKILNSSAYFKDKGDPTFFDVKAADGSIDLSLEFNANNGGGQSGLHVWGPGGFGCLSNDYWSNSLPYSTVFGETDPLAWHHYAIVWNTNGVSASSESLQVFLDGKKLMSAKREDLDHVKIAKLCGGLSFLRFSRVTQEGMGQSPYLIDEFRIWSTDKTTFSLEPIEPVEDEPSGDETGPAAVSEVSAKQHYPWAGKIDITYKVSGATEGLAVKIVVRDTIGCMNYTAKTFDVKPSAKPGAHTVVWNATADGVKVGSKAMVATVSLVVPEM